LKEVDRTLVAIDEANTHLKQLLNPFRIRLKGQALYLRGMYPAKPGDGLGNKRYELPMGGASTRGLRNVVTEAITIDKAIKERTFDWRRYIADQSPEEKTASQWIKEFKPHYMSGRKIEESTWEKHWASTLRKLPQSDPLREGLLLAVVLSTKQDSRVREQTCQRLQRFAEFAGIKVDLNPYIGNYEPLPRDIPEDAVIVEWRDHGIPNPALAMGLWCCGDVWAALGNRQFCSGASPCASIQQSFGDRVQSVSGFDVLRALGSTC
jgi:hypothetical protein